MQFRDIPVVGGKISKQMFSLYKPSLYQQDLDFSSSGIDFITADESCVKSKIKM